MWQMLDRPITEKESASGGPSGSLHLRWASSCMQGWRIGMEDAHICMPSLPATNAWGQVALFGVMDGHGGEQVAKFCERHLPEELCAFALQSPRGAEGRRNISSALVGAFNKMDDLLRDTRKAGPELRSLTNPPVPQAISRMMMGMAPNRVVDADLIGCTACFCAVTADKIFCANSGDSRAVLCRGGRAIPLSEDHKPNDSRERKRIEAAGGYVENTFPGQYRVNGNLNLSRALGDLEYKKDAKRRPEEQIITGTPDVEVFDRNPEDEFIVVCCDGVWDMKSNQEVVDFVKSRPDSSDVVILESLLDSCISRDLRMTKGLGGDNMTAVIVRFPRNLPRLLDARPSKNALDVSVAVPGCSSFTDLSLRVSAPTSKLEVGMQRPATEKPGERLLQELDLSEHIPSGVRFAEIQAPASFYASTETLKISIPLATR